MDNSLHLVNGSENYGHYHPEDRIPTHDTLARLQEVASQNAPVGDYTLTYVDDHVFCDSTCTITLPPARAGKEFEITLIASGETVTILPSGTDTLVGEDSVYIYVPWTSLRFKAVSNGYVLI